MYILFEIDVPENYFWIGIRADFLLGYFSYREFFYQAYDLARAFVDSFFDRINAFP